MLSFASYLIHHMADHTRLQLASVAVHRALLRSCKTQRHDKWLNWRFNFLGPIYGLRCDAATPSSPALYPVEGG